MIQVKLRKTFPARSDSAGFALELEFRAAAGITVLFGPSGSGKTLTLDSIAGFVRPDEGRILLEDFFSTAPPAFICRRRPAIAVTSFKTTLCFRI
jgi:ABC-type molybdate transport system ATPase subunit